jgi:hypothetical protein
MVDVERDSAGARMALVPAALRASLAATLEQVAADVVRYEGYRAATDFACQPAANVVLILRGVLAVEIAVLDAARPKRLTAAEAGCPLADSWNARLHVQLEAICSLVGVARFAVSPRHRLLKPMMA